MNGLKMYIGAALAVVMLPNAAHAGPRIDAIAEDYVRLVLEYGTHEDGYVDAYYGPERVRIQAEENPRGLRALARETERLRLATLGLAWPSDRMEQKRRRFMVAQLSAVATRIAMTRGATFTFSEEAGALFGVTPDIPTLDSFQPLLDRVEALVPGDPETDGPLWQRVDALKARYHIPAKARARVMEAAIARCKAATEPHIDLPDGERFDLEFVTGKPWSGYNWYKGNAHSLIQINTDLPISIDRAVDLGCHEGYPGHHTLNALLEQRLVRERGWAEFAVYPLYSPQSLIAEGTANAGIDVAFPGEARTAYEAEVLYPLAGLDPATAETLTELNTALRALYPAQYSVADAYLSGRMTKADAITALQETQLNSPERAAQRLDFIDTYRSYIVNYDIGRNMVDAYLDRHGTDVRARWAAFETLISEPTLPDDLEK
ncbi:MAG: hypothetical protein WA979_07845 [Pacificimonas sp.]